MKQVLLFLLMVVIAAFGCRGDLAPQETTLMLGGYSGAREAYKKIIPLFQKYWKTQTGQTVVFKESYSGSGTQSRSIASGFEADVAVLATETDVQRLVEHKLVTHDWKRSYGGMVTHSVVVLAVRQGNPKQIYGWEDLVRGKIDILMPNPKTSGGAQWTVLAIYGAAIRGKLSFYKATQEGAEQFLVDILKNVSVMDKGARDSMINFEHGAGEAAITYESEVLIGQSKGQTYEYIIPESTILIENPVALVDVYADKHQVREVAEAFIEFLFSKEAQTVFAETGFRPVNKSVSLISFPAISDLWTVQEMGGWGKVKMKFFSQEGIFTKATEEVLAR